MQAATFSPCEGEQDGSSRRGDPDMGSTSDKISGKMNEIAGKTKQAVGKATGDNEMRAKGAVQEGKGKTQTAVGKAKDTVKNAVDRL
jgi:uncharacterized protein YjbJ (UPF0337 family)